MKRLNFQWHKQDSSVRARICAGIFVAFAGVAMLVSSGCATIPAVSPPGLTQAVPEDLLPPGFEVSKAVVRGKHGQVETLANGVWVAVHSNDELTSGTAIRTGSNSTVDLMVNGRTSTVRLNADSQMSFALMARTGPVTNGTTKTVLKIENGCVLGSVRKLPADSVYRIRAGASTAEIRGTDFAICADGKVTAVTGTVLVSAGGTNRVLTSGQQFDPILNQLRYLEPVMIYPMGRGITITPSPRFSMPTTLSPFDQGIWDAKHPHR